METAFKKWWVDYGGMIAENIDKRDGGHQKRMKDQVKWGFIHGWEQRKKREQRQKKAKK